MKHLTGFFSVGRPSKNRTALAVFIRPIQAASESFVKQFESLRAHLRNVDLESKTKAVRTSIQRHAAVSIEKACKIGCDFAVIHN